MDGTGLLDRRCQLILQVVQGRLRVLLIGEDGGEHVADHAVVLPIANRTVVDRLLAMIDRPLGKLDKLVC